MPPDTSPPVRVVAADHACVGCSYNLRGLPVEGVCPECGKPVSQSLLGDLLSHAAPDYLRTVHRGLVLALGAMVLGVALDALFTAIPDSLWAHRHVRELVRLAYLVPAAFSLLGYWWFARPDPGLAGAEPARAARRVVRVMVLVQAGWTLLRAGLRVSPLALTPGASVWLSVSGGLVVLIHFLAVMGYVRSLAGRIPDEGAARRARVYAWLLPMGYVLLWAAVFVFLNRAGLFFGLASEWATVLPVMIPYWLILNRFRAHVRSIRQRPAFELASRPGAGPRHSPANSPPPNGTRNTPNA